MAQDNVQKFEELLRTNEGLQAELKAAAEAYEGDRNDPEAIFDATLGKIAGGVGLAFTYDDALASFARARELGDAELDAISGGGGFCFIIGGSNDVEAECDDTEGHACAYIGVGGVNL